MNVKKLNYPFLFFVFVFPVVFIVLGKSIKDSFLVNATKSIPLGVYKKTEAAFPRVGLYAEACGPKWLSRYAPGDPACHGGVMVIKPVAAVPGQKIEIKSVGERRVVFIDGKNTGGVVKETDSLGFRLPVFEGGVVPKDRVFLFSTYNKKSADGRYFGLTNIKDIKGYYQCFYCLK